MSARRARTDHGYPAGRLDGQRHPGGGFTRKPVPEETVQGAFELVRRLARGPELVYFFWPTLMAYLRIVTHPGILPRPLAPPHAMRNVDPDGMYSVTTVRARPGA